MESNKNETVKLSFEEMKLIIKGKYSIQICHSCSGKGWYWVSEDGERIDAPTNLETDFKHDCVETDECKGLGFFLVFNS